jgi:large subunit ribosomal protein L9
MDVILLERVEKLGQMGDVVKVKPGFARNFLLPQRKALRATTQNIERFESRRVQLEAANLDKRKDAEAVAKKMEGITCVLLRQASESAQLYGSVSARDVAQAIGEEGAKIARNQVLLERPIKSLGVHAVRVMLHPEVIVRVNVNVARSVEEAQVQAAAHAAGKPMPVEIAAGVVAAESAAAAGGEEARAASAPEETETASETDD